MRLSTLIVVVGAVATVGAVFVPPWHRPVAGTQLGFRASSMVQFAGTVPAYLALNGDPAPNNPPEHYGVDPAALTDTRPATEAYPGITVPPGTTAGEFMKLHVAITNWTAPKNGCAFCHTGTNYASNAKPQMHTARVMTEMVRKLNADWGSHLGNAGVTCYTCHRGQNVPPMVFYPSQAPLPNHFANWEENWNYAASTVRDFFPPNGFEEYNLQSTPAHIQSNTALTSNGPAGQDEFKRQYEYMMQMSDGIGVNCGFCHNSRAFFDWGQSTPMRWSGLSGLHMTRRINNEVLMPLAQTMPQTREVVDGLHPPIIPSYEAGPQNGNALVICATCHYGAPKPLNGLNMAHDYPLLTGIKDPEPIDNDSTEQIPYPAAVTMPSTSIPVYNQPLPTNLGPNEMLVPSAPSTTAPMPAQPTPLEHAAQAQPPAQTPANAATLLGDAR